MDIVKLLEDRKKAYNEGVIKRDIVKNNLDAKAIELQEKKDALVNMEVSRAILQKTADQAREQARDLLESTITTALQHVFGNNFKAIIETDVSAGKPVAEIYVETDYGNGHVVRCKPEDSRGGGIVDIVSIALRIAMIQLHQEPSINGSVIFDEPGKHVSAEYSTKLAEFLKYISNQFNKQIIFVTHNQDLKSIADTCYVAELKEGTTTIKKIDARTGAELCTDVQTVSAEAEEHSA